MPLLTILIVLIVAGVLLWLVNNYIPMDRTIKNILNAVVVIALIVWLLKGIWDFRLSQGYTYLKMYVVVKKSVCTISNALEYI